MVHDLHNNKQVWRKTIVRWAGVKDAYREEERVEKQYNPIVLFFVCYLSNTYFQHLLFILNGCFNLKVIINVTIGLITF